MKINYTLNVLLYVFHTGNFIRSNNCKYKSGKQESCFRRIYRNYIVAIAQTATSIANNIANNNPGNVFLINIHQGRLCKSWK